MAMTMFEMKALTAERFIAMVVHCKRSIDELSFCNLEKDNFSRLYDKIIERTSKILDVIIKLTGKTKDEAYDLLTKRLMAKEDERQKFCEQYRLPHEYDSTCIQMNAIV